MTRVEHHGHGIYCYKCQEVHDGSQVCDHYLSNKAGVQKQLDGGFFAQPADMRHRGPHHFIDLDGGDQCAKCDRVKLSADMVENPVSEKP